MENREEEGVKVLETAYKEYITYLPYLHNQVSKRRWKGVLAGEITVEECGPSVFICLTKRIGKIEITFRVGSWQDYKDVGDTMIFTDIHTGVYVDVEVPNGIWKEVFNKFLIRVEKELTKGKFVSVKRRSNYFCYDITPFKAKDIFIKMLDVVVPIVNSFDFGLPHVPLCLSLNNKERELDNNHPLCEVNLLILPLGIPIMRATGKHEGMQFAIDPSKTHNYLFFRRVKEEGIDAIDDWEYFEPLATNVITKNDEIQRETEIKDIIVSAKMRFEGQKVARKILFEVKEGYETYMEQAEKIAGTSLHGVLGLPYLTKHLHILKMSAQLYDESMDGIINRSWCKEEPPL